MQKIQKCMKLKAAKWKFQKMWKRSEYIPRIVEAIRSDVDFDQIYQRFAASLQSECRGQSVAMMIESEFEKSSGSRRRRADHDIDIEPDALRERVIGWKLVIFITFNISIHCT